MSVRPIVLAEDNAKLRRMYTDLLASAGYQVICVVDGEKVVDLMHKVANPSAIILDVLMPKISGTQACMRIRKIQGLRSCPILFLTSLDTPQAMLECLKAGGDDFILKTLPIEAIIERVHFWARRGDSEENVERRQKAIHELEATIARSEEERRRLDEATDVEAEPTLKKLVAFVAERMEDFAEEDPIRRFGYLVGLFEAYAPRTIHDKQVFHFFLKKLIFKTGFIDPKSVDALLGSYQRLVQQNQFHKGRIAGRDDAPLIETSGKTNQHKAEAASRH